MIAHLGIKTTRDITGVPHYGTTEHVLLVSSRTSSNSGNYSDEANSEHDNFLEAADMCVHDAVTEFNLST